MTMKFSSGVDIVILVDQGESYIQQCSNTNSPHTITPGGNGVIPAVEWWSAGSNTSCSVDDNKYITDGNGSKFYQIVGPRPRNIFKR